MRLKSVPREAPSPGFARTAWMALAVYFALFALPLSAQVFRSTMTGQVTDPSGAAVPGAKIVATRTSTGNTFSTVSGPKGYFTVPFLPPGTYEIRVTAPGFKKFLHTGIGVQANLQVTENVRLQIGSSRQTVTVKANSPLVSTASASMGENITGMEVQDLPLNGRNPLALVRYSYAVIPKQKHLLNEVRPFDGSGADFALGGANSENNELLLNGVPDMSNGARSAGFSPPMDSVAEVKVQVFNTNAAEGHTLGGTVDEITKSGTNKFHGSLYEFNETSTLAANPFFLNKAGRNKPVTRQNQYGGSIGGPVLIPKLFNGRNKMFFFFAYEGFKDSTPAAATTTVPTAAERQGDFSALLNLGSAYQLYNPQTAVEGTTPAGGTGVVRQPFANNIIPTSMINPIAAKYTSYYPMPNQPGLADGENNYVVNDPTMDNYHSYVGRLDFYVTNRNKLYFELNHSDYTKTTGNIFNNIAAGDFSGFGMYQGVLDDVQTISPTFMWDNRIGLMRNVSNNVIASQGFNPTTLGFPSYIAQNSTQFAMPAAYVSGYQSLSGQPGSTQPFTDLEFFTSGTKVLNAHTLEFGMDFQAEQESFLSPGYSSGWYVFDNSWVEPYTGAPGIPEGGGIASFLLGLPDAGGYNVNTDTTYQNYYFAWFLQDNWHVRSNLTLDAGLRLMHETPVAERFYREIAGFNPTATNQATKAAEAAYAANPLTAPPLLSTPPSSINAAGGLIYASSSHPHAFTEPALVAAPRIGIAWAPHMLGMRGKTVIRAGFGLFNNPFGANPYNVGPNYGYSQNTDMVQTLNGYLTPYATLSNPYPGGSILQPVGSSLGVNANIGQGISFFYPHEQFTYSMRWTFDIQHQFGNNLMLDVGYIGNRMNNLTNSVDLSAVPVLPYLSRTGTRNQPVINELSANVSNPFQGLLPGTGLNGSTTSVDHLLGAYPQYSGVTEHNVPFGYANFGELAVRLEKRFSHGLQFNVDYNFSHQRETTPLNNGQTTNLSYEVTSSDYPNRFVISGIYQLPFGHGREFLGHANGVLNAIVGGWDFSSIYTWESGPAIGWGNVIYLGGPLNMHPRDLTQAFDTSRFDRNPADQLSYNYRTFGKLYNAYRADAANNVDVTMMKNFRLSERLRLQYRIDAFNAFNRAQFKGPNTSPTSSGFGTINSQANTPRALQMALSLTF